MEPEQTVVTGAAVTLPQENNHHKAYILGALALAGLFILAIIALSSAQARLSTSRANAAAAAAQEVPFVFEGLAKSVYVYDLAKKKVLYSFNPDTQLPLASITKVALVLAVSEVLAPEDTVVVSREAVTRGEGGGLGTGDTWRVRDLIDFTLAASSNAGAEVLAEAADAKLRQKYPQIPPEEGAAVWRMNEIARNLDLSHTYFLNPSGLDLSLTQASSMSSAREVATLVLHASEQAGEQFSGTTQFNQTLGPLNGDEKSLHNTNDALPDIPGLIMGKTGFTDLAGGNLAIVFEIGPGHRIVAVVMGSTYDGRFEDMREIVESVRERASAL